MTPSNYLEGNNAPSRDLVTKYILKDEVVRARITKEFVGEQHEYLLGDGETFDGKRCDVLYLSTTAQSVLIEVQRSVDVEFMARIINYCSGLCMQKKFGLGLPYVVIFCIEEPADNVKSQLSTPSCSLPYLELKSNFWAQSVRLYTPSTCSAYLETNPSPPSFLSLLSSFITQQQPSHYQLSRYPEYQLFYRLSVNFQELTNYTTTNNSSSNHIKEFCHQQQAVLKRLSLLTNEKGKELINEQMKINRRVYFDHCTPNPSPSSSSSTAAGTETGTATTTARNPQPGESPHEFIQRLRQNYRWKTVYEILEMDDMCPYESPKYLESSFNRKRRRLEKSQE